MQAKKSFFVKKAVRTILTASIIAGVLVTGGCSDASEDTRTTTGATSALVQEAPASSADLYCLEFISFSGEYKEDGKNEQVSDVAAILVENRSKVFLDRATITYKHGEKTATFIVTGLPAGEKCWVMEATKMKIDSNHSFEFLDCVSAFKEDAVTITDKLSVATKDNSITITNISDESLKNVCVYYKNINDDGSYLGGITYMLAFDTLSSGESVTQESAHFSDTSKIVRYSFQTGDS